MTKKQFNRHRQRLARHVTPDDMANAAIIAQLIGSADEGDWRDEDGDRISAEDALCCRERVHDCSHCGHRDPCGHEHGSPWDCIGAALDASSQAVQLYLAVGNLLGTCNAGDIAELSREEQAWLADLGFFEWDGRCSDLETAGVLLDGILPPGWTLYRMRTP